MARIPADVGVPQVRPPLQARSREAWERILRAGTELLEQGGPEALTITAVCERAQVAPTAIYARVDGIAGLFWAVYEWRFAEVRTAEATALARAADLPAGTPRRIRAVVRALVRTFEEHRSFLEPIVRYSANDPAMRERAARTSGLLVDEVAALLGGTQSAREVARLLHDERVMRVLYGPTWLVDEPETPRAFEARMERLAVALLR